MWNKRLFGISPQWLLYFSGREFMTTSYLKFILKKCKTQTTAFLEVTNFSYTVGNKVVIMNFTFGKKIKVCIIYSWKEQKSYFSYFCTYFHYNFCPLPYPCVLPLPGWYISWSKCVRVGQLSLSLMSWPLGDVGPSYAYVMWKMKPTCEYRVN